MWRKPFPSFSTSLRVWCTSICSGKCSNLISLPCPLLCLPWFLQLLDCCCVCPSVISCTDDMTWASSLLILKLHYNAFNLRPFSNPQWSLVASYVLPNIFSPSQGKGLLPTRFKGQGDGSERQGHAQLQCIAPALPYVSFCPSYISSRTLVKCQVSQPFVVIGSTLQTYTVLFRATLHPFLILLLIVFSWVGHTVNDSPRNG